MDSRKLSNIISYYIDVFKNPNMDEAYLLKCSMKLLDAMTDYTLILSKNTRQAPLKSFTLQELSQFDGSHGKPAYVAVNNNVYDVSKALSWGGGTHFGLYSGKNLTKEFASCHNKLEILNKLPIVGKLI